MNTINELLNKTPEEYENIILKTYFLWCMDFCINYHSDLQRILANSAVNKYFLYEYAKCEAEFLKLISRYEDSPTVTSKDIQTLYDDCSFKISNRNPKPLILAAKKLNIYDTARN
ncbi:hypothetical protein [Flavobacterium sp.]|uniref:hypothetical protein n=1 Tax=Flavobacterium sp. TaxID=239 RepID=UPI003751DFEE